MAEFYRRIAALERYYRQSRGFDSANMTARWLYRRDARRYNVLCYDPATVSNDAEIQGVLARMRREWDERAAEDANYYVYTRDRDFEERDFDESGRVNYDQLVRPSLPLFLNGRPPGACRAVEIGCGLGRMTRWFARDFLEVHGVDISAEMIAEARERLRRYSNVVLHVGSGKDLSFLPDAHFDFAFSYIVFQHIPSREIIENYVKETARVLKPGAVFKFQLNGSSALEYADRERDSWHGEVYSLSQACRMVQEADLAPIFADGIGTQYFLLAARKSGGKLGPGLSCLFPAQPGTEAHLLEGWQGAGEISSRSVRPRFRTLLTLPRSDRSIFFLAICFPPLEPFPAYRIAASIDGQPIGCGTAPHKGDHYFEWQVPRGLPSGRHAVATVEIDPPFGSADEPAVRSLGIYALRL